MSKQTLRIRLIVPQRRGYPRIFLPVSVVDARGQVLSSGAVASHMATELAYECGDLPVFARMALPNGTTETRSLLTDEKIRIEELTFNVGDNAITSDWMKWSATRLDLRRQRDALLNQPGMEDSWFQLWEKSPNTLRWRQISMKSDELHHSQQAIQFKFDSSPNPRALVARLDSTSPQVISLPNQKSNVLLTTLRTLSGKVVPRLIVGGYSPNAEAIMEFLRLGRLGSVETLLDPGSGLAQRLLQSKVDDPIAATAAAYYLLRKRDWERLPAEWLDNLANWFDIIPDAALIRAASRIERGMPIKEAATFAVETLSRILDRGMPLFAEATWLLSDLLAIAEKAETPLEASTVKTLRKMLSASNSSGLSFCFLGEKPVATPKSSRLLKNARKEPQPVKKMQHIYDVPRKINIPHQQLPNLDIPDEKLNITLSSHVKKVSTQKIRQQLTVPGNENKTIFLRAVITRTES